MAWNESSARRIISGLHEYFRMYKRQTNANRVVEIFNELQADLLPRRPRTNRRLLRLPLHLLPVLPLLLVELHMFSIHSPYHFLLVIEEVSVRRIFGRVPRNQSAW